MEGEGKKKVFSASPYSGLSLSKCMAWAVAGDSDGSKKFSASSSSAVGSRSSFLTVPSSQLRQHHRNHQQHPPQHLQQQSSTTSFPTDYYRERADSFGSTGSSTTDVSSSPYDSYWSSGQTTASRGSPAGSPLHTSSPPLSQAAGNSSKLLNILLGNISFTDNLTAYVEQDRQRQRPPHIHVNSPSPEHRPSFTSSRASPTATDAASAAAARHQASKRCSPSLERRDDCKRPAVTGAGDTPMDLTCKKHRTISEPSETDDSFPYRARASTVASGSSVSNERCTGERNTTILQSLLTSGCRISEPATPAATSPVPGHVYVGLAKRNQRHVQAHVADWVGKITRFALDQSEFRQLSEDTALALLTSTFPRLLLFCMAETNFHFAVAPSCDSVSGSPAGSRQGSPSRGQSHAPTMVTVEAVEAFIARCDLLKIDSVEYGLMKQATLFTVTGQVDVPAEVAACREVVMSRARIGLLEHVQRTQARHEYRSRYSNLLLTLHLLSGIEAEAVRRLFCADAADLATRLRDLRQRHADVNTTNTVPC